MLKVNIQVKTLQDSNKYLFTIFSKLLTDHSTCVVRNMFVYTKRKDKTREEPFEMKTKANHWIVVVIEIMNEKNSTAETNIVHKWEKAKKSEANERESPPHTWLLCDFFFIFCFFLAARHFFFLRQTRLTHISIAEILLVLNGQRSAYG